MIYASKPEIFEPKFEAVSCFIECGKDILFLLKQDTLTQQRKYEIPSRNLNTNEELKSAITQRTKEIISIDLSQSKIFYLGKLYTKRENCDFLHHAFRAPIPPTQNIVLNQREYKNYTWCSPEKALALPLSEDISFCIKLFYGL